MRRARVRQRRRILRRYLAGHPLMIVTVIFFQIVVTLTLVGVLVRLPVPRTRAGKPDTTHV